MPKRQGSRKSVMLLIGIVLVGIATIILFYGSKSMSLPEAVQNFTDQFSLARNKVENPFSKTKSKAPVIYKFAILSDSHEDTTIYPQIVEQIARRSDVDFVVHLGDQVNAGEISKLQESKGILDRISAPVYVLPGDHDLNWVPRHDLTNFKSAFGLSETSYAMEHKGDAYIFIDNSDSINGLTQSSWTWLKQQLERNADKKIFIFMSTPLSNPYLSFKAMGSQSETVKQQSKKLGQLLSRYPVKVIFAGDTHTFSQFKDEDSALNIVTVGAAGTNKNPLPMYVAVEILSDGSYNVTSMPFGQN